MTAAAAIAACLTVVSIGVLPAFGQGVPPPQGAPQQVLPPQDPAVLQMENELKERRHQESLAQNPADKEALLKRILVLCINLGRECPSYEQKLELVRLAIAQQQAKDQFLKKQQQDNQAHKKRARELLSANPPDLQGASSEVKAALRLFKSDPESQDLATRVDIALKNQLYRRIAMVVMLTIATLAVLVPLLKSKGKGVKVRELEMLVGPDPGEVFQLQKEKTSLGAVASEADIVITDPFRKISRRHCEINRSGRHYFLIDSSTNGTLINDKPAPRGEPVLLKKGDRIALADDVVLRFR